MISSQESLAKALKVIGKEENCVLLWTAKEDRENQRSFLFSKPQAVISCERIEDVETCFKKIEGYLNQNFYAAGYIAYEAGLAFEENLKKLFSPGPILIWFGIYRAPIILESRASHCAGVKNLKDSSRPGYLLKPAGFNVTKGRYLSCIKKIKGYIAKGLTYQVNYTIKKYFQFQGNPYKLFSQLCNNQKVPYAAFIKNDYEYILSFSPELFFRCNKGRITVRPMKGTIKRSNDVAHDWANAICLRDSYKDRAENVMIVDLLRNDLGRVSRPGSVKTKSLFDVERLETLWQMTSTVNSHLKNNLSWLELFKNIFPSGSVTGAPKIKTIEIISKLENSPRGVYTGSIGYISPDKNAVFNVAIRTLRIEKTAKRCELGIGSGIIWDSQAEKEWQECQLKGDFLKGYPTGFELIETMSLKKGKIRLLDYHLERLEESAFYFDFNFDRKYLLFAIKRFIARLNSDFDYKLRLLLSRNGHIKLSYEELANFKYGIRKIIFSKKNTDSRNIFLYHKTTQRDLYNREHKYWRKRGYFDCLFMNEKGEVTEGAITNIFIEKDNQLFTPLASCGLLNGVYRRCLLENSNQAIKERILYEDDIYKANKIYLTNAVSGIITAQLKKYNHK